MKEEVQNVPAPFLKKALRFCWYLTAAGLVGFVVTCWITGSSLVATANRSVGVPPDDLPIEVHSIASESGCQLAAWYSPRADATATVALLHPLRGNRASMIGRAKLFHRAGFAVLMIDLQGHGESDAKNITMGHLEKHDARAAVEFAKRLNQNHRIGVVGWSLGGASILLSSPNDIDCLVLESVYPTIEEAVNNRIKMRLGFARYVLAPALLFQLKPRLGISAADLRPIDFIGDAGCPVLVAAGDCDFHTPIDETRKLYEKAIEPKQLVLFEGAQHVDLLNYDRETYEAKIIGFMIVH